MDPARPTRFEKKKNMLPNVPPLQQFHLIDVLGKHGFSLRQTAGATYHPDQAGGASSNARQ
jgi:hypothetical protein